MTLADFESLVLSQRPAAKPWEPVTDYSFEARKAIEGIHPQLILDVLKPRNLLDVGCGFGHLVRMVNDLAGEEIAIGADVQNPAAAWHFDLAAEFHVPYRYDVVTCREVLEHLTVRQIRKAVTNLCGLSDRLLYVTTRFHPHPNNLLDVSTADDLDPTHISMLNQDFLRVLFVLEGFKRRADYEQRLDWQQKGRCLVYELVA